MGLKADEKERHVGRQPVHRIARHFMNAERTPANGFAGAVHCRTEAGQQNEPRIEPVRVRRNERVARQPPEFQ